MPVRTVHLVSISKPPTIAEKAKLLRWVAKNARAVPMPDDDGFAIQILSEGVVCEIDAADLAEARAFGDVEIMATKERQ